MAVTHYDPFFNHWVDESESEIAWCGTILGEKNHSTNKKDYVSCRRCIKAFDKIDTQIQDINNHRNDEDSGFVAFYNYINI